MSAKEILIPLLMVGLTVSLNAIINTKIKFAATHDHAIKDIKRILMLIVFCLSQAYFAWSLFSELSSDAPLTRHSLALILILSFGLFNTCLMYVFFKFIDKIIDIIGRMNDASQEHLGVTKDVLRSVDSQPNMEIGNTLPKKLFTPPARPE
jgi:predicted PurR-regulated permease PerM